MSDDSTKKINVNKMALAAEEKQEEKSIHFSIVSQLQNEEESGISSLDTGEDTSSHSVSVLQTGGSGSIDISNIQLLKLQTDVDKLESQIKLISTYASEAKLLESEMNKIIKKIYQVQPKLKPLLMRMKKLLKDHSDLEKVLMVARDKVEDSSAIPKESPQKASKTEQVSDNSGDEVQKEKKEEEESAGSMADFTREIKLSDFDTDGAA